MVNYFQVDFNTEKWIILIDYELNEASYGDFNIKISDESNLTYYGENPEVQDYEIVDSNDQNTTVS